MQFLFAPGASSYGEHPEQMPARLTVVGESCPVCGSEAERGQDTRDVVNIRCPRCGPFTISGTALTMLTSRLKGNECSRARASHAIRSATSDEHWLEIDSTSVDKLVDLDLPPLERQVVALADTQSKNSHSVSGRSTGLGSLLDISFRLIWCLVDVLADLGNPLVLSERLYVDD